MSVRIHQLSKEIGIENKELIAILQERGYDIKTASSTVDNISAESLLEEFKAKREEAEKAEAKADAAGEAPEAEKENTTSVEIAEKPSESAKPAAPSVKLPEGVFVKSADDVLREREEKKAANNRPKQESAAPATPPAPAARPATPQPPRAAPPPPPTPSKSPGATPPISGRGPASKSPAPVPPPIAGSAPRTPPRPRDPAAAAQQPSAEPPAGDEAKPGEEGEEEKKDDVKIIQVKPPIVVRDFAVQIGLKPFQLISELMEMNIFASMNQVIEEEVAVDIAGRHGFLLDVKHRGEAQAPAKAKAKPKVDESKLLEPRPPVVCILGHVDHGKTTLLDNIRKANVVSGEAGGITQHIGAYQVEVHDKKITFLDTPGHAAFSKMRARGADVTDIAILIVAADDGFMPQTDEALKHAQAAGVPIIVALNKMDTKGANVERVKQQMQERNIASEDWGGETITAPISALKGEGIDHLLEMVLLQAEILELKANPKCPASGAIVEAEIEVGRGPSATVIVQKGTLKNGDALICGSHYCKVRAMFDDSGKALKQAPPSTPVRVIGWSDAPEAGSVFETVKSEREAKQIAAENEGETKKKNLAAPAAPRSQSVDDLFAAIASTQKKSFRAVVRCDMHGSLEAVCGSLKEIKSDKVDVDIVQSDVGMISKNDVLMANASEAAIIGFNVKLEQGVKNLAKHHGVAIHTHTIIYELIDQVRLAMADQLDPEIRENKLGAAEVRQVFPVGKNFVAGCLVTEGKIVRDSKVRLMRNGEVVVEGKVSTLRRFRDDANEVRAGYECGIGLDKSVTYQPGDTIESFEIQKIRANL